MNLAVFVIGIIGGILVSLSLVYPLYGYLPGLYGVNLMPTQIIPAVGFIILAGLLVVLTGWLAGRRCGLPSRWGTVKAGGVAGFVAVMFAFETIIASAAGIPGNKEILLHGLIPEADEMKYVALIYHGVSGTIRWYAIGLWGSILCGIVLGGFGGALAKSKFPNRTYWLEVFPMISPVMLFVSATIFLVTIVSLSILMDTLLEVGKKINYSDSFNDPRIFFFIICLAEFLWVVFWQVRLWMDLKAAQKSHDYQYLSWAVAGLSSIVIPILFFIVVVLEKPDLSSWPIWLAALYLLAIGILTFRQTFWQIRKRTMPMITNPFNQPGLYLRGGIILSIMLAISNSLAITQLSLSLVVLTVSFIGPLLSTSGASTMSLEEVVHDAYVIPGAIAAASFLVPLIYILLLVWTLNNSYTFLRQYGAGVFERMGSTLRNIGTGLKIRKSQ